MVGDHIVGNTHCWRPYCHELRRWRTHCWRRATFTSPPSATPFAAMLTMCSPVVQVPIICDALYPQHLLLMILLSTDSCQHTFSAGPFMTTLSFAALLLAVPIVRGHILYGPIVRDTDCPRYPSSTILLPTALLSTSPSSATTSSVMGEAGPLTATKGRSVLVSCVVLLGI